MRSNKLPKSLFRITAFLFIFLASGCRDISQIGVSPRTGSARTGFGAQPNACNGCPPYTVADKFRALQQAQTDTKDIGGNEGLVNTVTAASVSWTQMKGANDYDAYNSTANQVRSTGRAVWQKYVPSLPPEFAAKGYDVKYSIDWSSGIIPNTLTPRTKLRFTH